MHRERITHYTESEAAYRLGITVAELRSRGLVTDVHEGFAGVLPSDLEVEEVEDPDL